jgi:integrase
MSDSSVSLNRASAKVKRLARWEKVDTNLKRYLATGIIYIDARVHGKAVCESTKTTDLAEARLIRNKRLHEEGQVAAAGGNQETARQWTVRDRLMAERESLTSYAKKESSKAYYMEILGIIEKTWPNLGQKIRAISATDIQAWLKKIQRYSGPRYNRVLTTMGKFFKQAVSKGARLDNPIDDLPRKKVAVSKKLTLPTEDEFKELVEEIRKVEYRAGKDGNNSADFVLFLRYTGCRIGEASWLKLTDVDVKKWQLNIPGLITKNGHPRSVPIVPPLRPIITKWLKAKERGEFLSPSADCRKAIANACARIPLPRLTPHDLRHLFITSCIELGFRAVDIAPWVGHRDNGALILRTYTQVRDKHQQEQVALLNEKLAALAAKKAA